MANAEENNFCFATVVTGAAICLPLIYAMLIRVKRQKLYKEIPMVENSDGRTISAVDKPVSNSHSNYRFTQCRRLPYLEFSFEVLGI